MTRIFSSDLTLLSDQEIEEHIEAIGFKLMESEARICGYRLHRENLLREQAERVLDEKQIREGDLCSIEFDEGRTAIGKYEGIVVWFLRPHIKFRRQLKSGKMAKRCEHFSLGDAECLEKLNKENMK